jgi:Tol biopolymer transport system component
MQETDGSEKPVVYETGDLPQPVHKNSFDTNIDGNVLVWTEKNSGGPAEVWRWDLQNGQKDKVGEGFLAGQATVSQDGSTMAWVETEKDDAGRWISELHWRRGDEEKIVSADIEGGNNSPSLSADGKTLVWMWKHPKVNFDHEIRKAVFD